MRTLLGIGRLTKLVSDMLNDTDLNFTESLVYILKSKKEGEVYQLQNHGVIQNKCILYKSNIRYTLFTHTVMQIHTVMYIHTVMFTHCSHFSAAEMSRFPGSQASAS